ncbi:MAG TPA: hypothetical protein VGU66_21505 [Candidatus Elarobacter sp.]|nr:hypothetical protein [Candidatus Elarobacter sp.]
MLITRSGPSGKGSFEKATGTVFVERGALGGMTGGLDAVILSYGGRRRNAGLERAGIEPAREGCRVLPTIAFGKVLM